ncbi:MAG: hypothetical protein AB1696_04740 [Planctomycetota bacterium]
MWKDPIVEEVRRIRKAHAAKFNYDLHEICRDLREQQKQGGRKVVSFPPKRIQKDCRVAEESSDWKKKK